MSSEVIFLIIFLSIILASVVITALVTRKSKRIVYEHTYKVSKDYERLWDLVVVRGAMVCRMDPNSGFYFDAVKLSSIDSDRILGFPNELYVSSGKERFIAYCTYKNISFLDFTDWPDDDWLTKHF